MAGHPGWVLLVSLMSLGTLPVSIGGLPIGCKRCGKRQASVASAKGWGRRLSGGVLAARHTAGCLTMSCSAEAVLPTPALRPAASSVRSAVKESDGQAAEAVKRAGEAYKQDHPH